MWKCLKTKGIKVHINKDTLYEIEYKVTKTQNQCIYKVTYIKSVNAFIERINFIVNMFNKGELL